MKILSIFGGAFFLIGILLVVVGTMFGGNPFQTFHGSQQIYPEWIEDDFDASFDIYDDVFFRD